MSWKVSNFHEFDRLSCSFYTRRTTRTLDSYDFAYRMHEIEYLHMKSANQVDKSFIMFMYMYS